MTNHRVSHNIITIRFHLFIVTHFPDSKIHGANMGPIWDRKDPGGPHVAPMNLVIWFGNSLNQLIQLIIISINPSINHSIIHVVSFPHSVNRVIILSLANSPTDSVPDSLNYLLTHSLTHSLAHSLTCSLTHSLTHSFNQSIIQTFGQSHYPIWNVQCIAILLLLAPSSIHRPTQPNRQSINQLVTQSIMHLNSCWPYQLKLCWM